MYERDIDWKAVWIAPAGVEKERNLYFYARKKFVVANAGKKRFIHIAAESFYRLFINGEKAASGPARGNKSTNFYDTIDITEYCREGKNHLLVWVFCPNMHNHLACSYQPALLVQINDGYVVASDSSWQIRIAEEWERYSQAWANKLGLIEARDYRINSDKWENAVEVSRNVEIGGKRLLPRDIPLLRETLCRPVSLVKSAYVPENNDWGLSCNLGELLTNEKHLEFNLDNPDDLLTLQKDLILPPPENGQGISLIFDFQKEISGGFILELTSPSGTIIDIGYDEILTEESRLRISHFSPGSHNYCARFITANGRQEIMDYRNQMGYRYLQIVLRDFNEPVIIHALNAVDIRYPYIPQSSFTCDDPVLNKIWDACAETIAVCTNDTFMDCPWRERALWINDMIVTGLTSIQLFGDERIAKRCLKLANTDRRIKNLVPAIVPATSWDRHILIPTTLYFLLELYDYWMYSGDTETLKEILPAIEKNYRTFESWEDEYCHLTPPAQYWNFFEWSYESCDISLDGKKNANLNWLYAWCLRIISELLKFDGNTEKAEYYSAKIPRIVEGMKKRFKVAGQKYYADWLEEDGSQSELVSQLSHAFAILSGALPESEAKDLADNALFNSRLHEAELFMSHFLFLATEKAGSKQRALDKIRRYWGNIIKTGSTTIWENAVYKPGREFAGGSGSLCHAFSTGPVSFFQRVILGIRPLEPGFKRFSIEPELLDLSFVCGKVVTPHGCIFIECENNAHTCLIKIEIPDGTVGIHENKTYCSGKHQITLDIKHRK
jgi:hypothetical protein